MDNTLLLPRCRTSLFSCASFLSQSPHQADSPNKRFSSSQILSEAAHAFTVTSRQSHVRPGENKASTVCDFKSINCHTFVSRSSQGLLELLSQLMKLEGDLSKKRVGYNRVTFLLTSGAVWDKLAEYSLVVVVARWTPAVGTL